MNPTLEPLINELQSRFGERITGVTTFRDDTVVAVDKSAIVDVVTYLRDNELMPFPLLEDVFGIDMFTRKDRFRVSYHLYSLEKKVRLHLTVYVDEDDLKVPSICGVFPAADWCERETYDMIGVAFEGHPDMRRAYMPEDYPYYPLRKDFPLMGHPDAQTLPKR